MRRNTLLHYQAKILKQKHFGANYNTDKVFKMLPENNIGNSVSFGSMSTCDSGKKCKRGFVITNDDEVHSKEVTEEWPCHLILSTISHS